jgi:hypothetical protein
MKVLSFLRKPVGFEGHFTQIPNSWARDERLGYRAKGILLLLMSHQNGWKISLEHLANDGPDGITAVRTAILQLQESGYLIRNTIRNDKNQIEGSEWILQDPFEKFEKVENLTSENLTSENLEENLISGNLTLKNTTYKEDNRTDIIDAFEKFWEVYPRKIGKAAALKAFEKAAKKTEPAHIIECVISWTSNTNLPEMQFIPHPTTWLNQGRWQDDLGAVSQSKNASSIAADIITRSAAMNSRMELE